MYNPAFVQKCNAELLFSDIENIVYPFFTLQLFRRLLFVKYVMPF